MGQKSLSLRLSRFYVLLVLSFPSFRRCGPRSAPHPLRRFDLDLALAVWVAKDTGLFAKNGLNIEPVQIRGGALITMGNYERALRLSGVGADRWLPPD